MKLSEVLTGFDNLSPEAAKLYYQQLSQSNKAELESLLSSFEALTKDGQKDLEGVVREKIWNDAALKSVCQSIILIWYNAAISSNNVVTWQAPPQFYYDALLWRAVEAHPPALSGGYFGYWRYAPEN